MSSIGKIDLKYFDYRYNELSISERINIFGTIEEKRRYVKYRDRSTCQLCGNTNNIILHHLKGSHFSDSYELKTNNLICLCKSCHRKVHNNPYHKYYPIDKHKEFSFPILPIEGKNILDFAGKP